MAVAVWVFAIGEWQSEPRNPLATARNRKLTIRLDAPAEVSCTIDARSSDAVGLRVLESDLWVFRRGESIFRGRVIGTPETLSADRHDLTITATDYRALLSRRYMQTAQSFAATPQADIAWALIAHTQAQPGGNLGITRGTTSSGQPRDRAWLRGDNIGDRIAEMGRVSSGFDWWVDVDRRFHLASPERGVVTNVVLDYGGAVLTVRRDAEAAAFANQVTTTGGEGTTPEAIAAADVSTDSRGRWEQTSGFPSVVEQATLQSKATQLLADGQRPPVTYALRLAPDVWRETVTFDLGDTVWIRLVSGLRSEFVPARVEELSVSVSEDGDEQVDVACTATSLQLEREVVW